MYLPESQLSGQRIGQSGRWSRESEASRFARPLRVDPVGESAIGRVCPGGVGQLNIPAKSAAQRVPPEGMDEESVRKRPEVIGVWKGRPGIRLHRAKHFAGGPRLTRRRTSGK